MMKVNHKTKKITAAISAALATSILATTAFAAAPDSLPVFDTDTKGSITVHKYQTDDENYVGSKGTGLASDIDKIDTTKVSPLANVTFTLFQIGGTDSIGTSAPTYSSELLEQNTSTNKWSYDNIEETKSVITDSEGLAAFTDLNLGRYLVVETKAPNSVVTKSEPFFVDVPMTDTTNNNSWLYDIHAFPKNVVKYDTPDIDKAITDIGNKHETASKGDTLSWIISSATPTTLNDYNKYILSDTLDDKLSFVANSVKITWGADYDTATEVNASNYTLTVPTSSKGGSISVSFKADYLSSLTESTETTTYYFFVTYKTKVIEAAFDTDGNLLPMKVEYLKSGDGINTVDEVVETKEIPMKIVSVTVDYKNNGKTALSNVMFNGGIALLAEYGENMQFDAYMNEKPGTGDIWDCVNEESIGFSQEVYLSDVHGGERHNNYINTINPGETVTVRMAFKVPEEKLNEMYFTLSNYGGSHFYDETSLQLGYVDIRQ